MNINMNKKIFFIVLFCISFNFLNSMNNTISPEFLEKQLLEEEKNNIDKELSCFIDINSIKKEKIEEDINIRVNSLKEKFTGYINRKNKESLKKYLINHPDEIKELDLATKYKKRTVRGFNSDYPDLLKNFTDYFEQEKENISSQTVPIFLKKIIKRAQQEEIHANVENALKKQDELFEKIVSFATKEDVENSRYSPMKSWQKALILGAASCGFITTTFGPMIYDTIITFGVKDNVSSSNNSSSLSS